MDEQKLVKAMVGREIKDFFGERKSPYQNKETALAVHELTSVDDYLKNISFSAYSGEILGISGLVGAGRTELVRCIYGADNYKSGEIEIFGRPLKKGSICAAIAAGIAFATEDRKNEGLFAELSVLLNTVFIKTAHWIKSFVLPRKIEADNCISMINRLSIKVNHFYDPVNTLSGGNQQKLILAKWLLTQPRVFILDRYRCFCESGYLQHTLQLGFAGRLCHCHIFRASGNYEYLR
jgi:ABC-type sugar transport system ATPase subunit